MSAGRRPGLAMALALVLALAATAGAADQAWLLGRWEMIRDPDGNPTDWLEFATDGRVASIKPSGQRVSGRYVATEAEVQLNFKVGSQSVIITLTPGSDRTELFARSARTGNTAVYEKRP
jgi:uncharacterized protein (DUF2147 family)